MKVGAKIVRRKFKARFERSGFPKNSSWGARPGPWKN